MCLFINFPNNSVIIDMILIGPYLSFRFPDPFLNMRMMLANLKDTGNFETHIG